VSVIDCSTNAVVKTVRVGTGPAALCYNPRRNRVYCANGQSYSVSVIDCSLDSVIATIVIGPGHLPGRMYYNPDLDRVYLANGGADNVKVIDCATNTVRRTVNVGHSPVEFACYPVELRTYVANNGSSSISVLKDTMPGVQESHEPQAAGIRPRATIVRGVLRLRDCHPVSAGETGGCIQPVLLDVAGRKVLDLRSGANDVRGLAPGVYFVREQRAGSRELSVAGGERSAANGFKLVIVP
jgi:YVTN family beta-propeller protein